MTRSIYIALFASMLVLGSCEDDQAPSLVEESAGPNEEKEPAAPVQPSGPKKLDYYIEYYQLSDAGYSTATKIEYEYTTEGKLNKYTLSVIDPKSGVSEMQRYSEFLYKGDQVDKINAFTSRSEIPYAVDTYEYFPDGNVSRIRNTDRNSGVNGEVNFIYDTPTEMITTEYTFSNGQSFEYAFRYTNGNVLADKTIKGTQLCSDGLYTYDDHINPLGNMGYVDYLLINLSKNNKLTETVNHVNCAFPTLVPESYSYEYDDEGYPSVVITLYKSKGTQVKSRREYFYN